MELSDVILVLVQVSGLLFVVTSMLAMGLALTIPMIMGSISNVKLMLLAVVANFIVVPALAYGASEILISDIYQAVRQNSLLGRSNDPNPACPIGKQINAKLEELYAEAELTVLQKLGRKTLADFANQFS